MTSSSLSTRSITLTFLAFGAETTAWVLGFVDLVDLRGADGADDGAGIGIGIGIGAGGWPTVSPSSSQSRQVAESLVMLSMISCCSLEYPNDLSSVFLVVSFPPLSSVVLLASILTCTVSDDPLATDSPLLIEGEGIEGIDGSWLRSMHSGSDPVEENRSEGGTG